MPTTYRVAVIGRTGKGDYGHRLDVVWKALDNVKIVAVADEDEKGRAAAAERLGADQAYADYRKMLDKEQPHIVCVADRWVDCHKDMVIACAEAGANIFLEKPMARTLAEADEMVKACETRHVKLAIALQTRYSPRLQRVRDLIGDGRLGDLIEMRGRGKEDHRGGGEDLMILGVHFFDMMRFFAGEPRSCFARILHKGNLATKGDVAEGIEGMGPVLGDHIQAIYGFDKSVHGFFATHKAAHGAGSRFGLHIYGTKGVIQLTTGTLPEAYFLDDPSWVPHRKGTAWQEITSAGLGKPEPLTDRSLGVANMWIAKDVIEAIEKDRQPQASMYDGRAALEMVLAVYESHRLNRAVTLPLENREHPLKKWTE
jgi:predicted dehydrogenase